MDELVLRLDALTKRDTQEVLGEIKAALAEPGAITKDVMIAAAYIAGIEDAITGTAGRPEYDLRLHDFSVSARASLVDTGRAIGDAASKDLISQAMDG
jgi:hypothetical protein